jgi:hypothetical protein
MASRALNAAMWTGTTVACGPACSAHARLGRPTWCTATARPERVLAQLGCSVRARGASCGVVGSERTVGGGRACLHGSLPQAIVHAPSKAMWTILHRVTTVVWRGGSSTVGRCSDESEAARRSLIGSSGPARLEDH